MVIDDSQILLDKADALCVHSLSALLHRVVALDRGIDTVELVLINTVDRAYFQCVESGHPRTKGDAVLF